MVCFPISQRAWACGPGGCKMLPAIELKTGVSKFLEPRTTCVVRSVEAFILPGLRNGKDACCLFSVNYNLKKCVHHMQMRYMTE